MTAAAIVVIVNAGSGGGNDAALVDRLAVHFKAAGLHAEIELAHGGDEIITAVGNAVARRPPLIVAGGGDGTVSTVAAALVDTGIAFGVLPLGTLNHFAKDLGIPLELADAVAVLAHGEAGRVDVGEVNGRIFVNNSSLGLYPDIVHDRERQQKRLRRGKWPAFVWATLSALRRYPFLFVALVVDGKEVLRRTPFVFIGNNEYVIDGMQLGGRKRIDQGSLFVYLAPRARGRDLPARFAQALVSRTKRSDAFEMVASQDLAIHTRTTGTIRVAVDGEVVKLSTPLRYRTRQGALQVLVPRQ